MGDKVKRGNEVGVQSEVDADVGCDNHVEEADAKCDNQVKSKNKGEVGSVGEGQAI